MAATAPDIMFSLKAEQRGTNAPLVALSFHQEKFFPENPQLHPCSKRLLLHLTGSRDKRGWDNI